MGEPAFDTVSELLRNVRLRGAMFYDVRGGRSWRAGAPPAHAIADALMPGSDHVMEYHVVTRGHAWASVAGDTPVLMSVGDIVVVPHGDAHVVASAPTRAADAVDVAWFRATADAPKPIPISFVGAVGVAAAPADDNAETVIACGFLACDLRPFNPLIAALPRLLHVGAEGAAGWSVQAVQQAVSASYERRPGGAAVLERLSETMFVDAIRRYVSALPDDATGWLAGLRDPSVGAALAHIHAAPGYAWTVDALGARINLGRSALHERFVRFVGMPPMQYVARWRMQVAANRLRHGDDPLLAVGLSLGYASEAAFSRAFTRIVGVPPSEWRRHHRAA